MIERVTVVKFRVNCGCGNGAGCFEVKVWADTAKFTDVIVARLRKCSDLSEKVRCSSKIKPRLRAQWVISLDTVDQKERSLYLWSEDGGRMSETLEGVVCGQPTV